MPGSDFRQALVAGLERVAAWSELLDRINVFPVADGDTGRNLVISLAPLRNTEADRMGIVHDLLLSARGNAGNIASRFFHTFIWADTSAKLPDAVRQGRDQAWQAVGDPRPGTMLTFFDGLTEAMAEAPERLDRVWISGIMEDLAGIVRGTIEQQPRLKKAGVVDAGALGMFLFFDGYLHALAGCPEDLSDIASAFGDGLHLLPSFDEGPENGYCVDMILSCREGMDEKLAELSGNSDSLVMIREKDMVKVHLHTADPIRTRQRAEAIGSIIRWSDDDLHAQTAAFQGPQTKQALHVMTDGAGSLDRQEAHTLGVTLLDSYITLGGVSQPESCLRPEMLYAAMRDGQAVSTSQASVFGREQMYQSVVSMHGRTLYLCVGAVFTGNFDTARQWKSKHDREDRLTILDTGCASGRLGLLAAMTARFAGQTDAPEAVVAFAKDAIPRCREYIFIDRLQYLAAGGRLSKGSAFFGDMIHMKPVISPESDGARKVGIVRNRSEQKAFALKRLAEALPRHSRTVIWLEYTDNREWTEEFRTEIGDLYPEAEIAVKPLSLTTGAHTGPGTWAVAFYADEE